jgi:beta-lactamase superfamily II metal-dependent hydrolase
MSVPDSRLADVMESLGGKRLSKLTKAEVVRRPGFDGAEHAKMKGKDLRDELISGLLPGMKVSEYLTGFYGGHWKGLEREPVDETGDSHDGVMGVRERPSEEFADKKDSPGNLKATICDADSDARRNCDLNSSSLDHTDKGKKAALSNSDQDESLPKDASHEWKPDVPNGRLFNPSGSTRYYSSAFGTRDLGLSNDLRGRLLTQPSASDSPEVSKHNSSDFSGDHTTLNPSCERSLVESSCSNSDPTIFSLPKAPEIQSSPLVEVKESECPSDSDSLGSTIGDVDESLQTKRPSCSISEEKLLSELLKKEILQLPGFGAPEFRAMNRATLLGIVRDGQVRGAKVKDYLDLYWKPHIFLEEGKPVENTEILSEYAVEIEPDTPTTRLNFYALNVGVGNLMIATIGTKAMIFDAGTKETSTEGSDSKSDALRDRFIAPAVSILMGKTIELVLITHPHRDHFNLLTKIIPKSGNEFRKIQFVCGGYSDQIMSSELRLHIPRSAIFSLDPDSEKDSPPFVRRGVDEMKLRIQRILGDRFKHENVTFEVFLPRRITHDIKNRDNIHITSNILLKLIYYGRSILFTGDGMPETIDNLSEDQENPMEDPFGEIDVYIVPHHGSKHNSINGYFGKRCPKVVLCSTDSRKQEGWRNGFPSQLTMEKYASLLPHTAKMHKVMYWNRWHPPDSFKFSEAGDPLLMDVDFPFYTTADSFFMYRGKPMEGLHIRFDPKGEGSEAVMELMNGEGQMVLYYLDDFAGTNTV